MRKLSIWALVLAVSILIISGCQSPENEELMSFQANELLIAYPVSWPIGSTAYECATVTQLDSLKLIMFEACPDKDGKMLDKDGGYKNFLAALTKAKDKETTVTKKKVGKLDVDLISYDKRPFTDNIYTILSPEGTIALWQGKASNYALLDEGNQHQKDGKFELVLNNIELL